MCSDGDLDRHGDRDRGAWTGGGGGILILAEAYACSTDRRSIDVRTLAWVALLGGGITRVMRFGMAHISSGIMGVYARLGLRAMLAGTLANFMTASIVGLLL